MKKKVLFAVIVSMLGMFPFTGIASTSVKLSIEDFQIAAGEEKEMIIDLSNPSNEITLVQFDMYLPNGLSIKINGGDYDIDMAGRTNWRKHSLEVNFIDGYYRFLLYSGSNALIDGSQGAIIKAKLVANSSFNGGVVELKNILCVNPDQVETKPENVVYEIQSVSAKEKLQITASPSGGEVTKGTKVTLTAKTTTGTAVSGADIYYTLNGTTPTKNSTKYTSAGITINESCTLKAIAYKDGYETSAVIEEKYTVKDETPIISISSFTCQNTTLTQNDKLVVRATIKNTGASYTLKSRLTICTVNENGKLSSKYKGTEISKYISSNGEVTIDYEYSLTNVASGDYVATVMWYRDWGNTDDWGWYYSTKTENRAQFTIKENQNPKLAVTASPSGGEVTKGTKVTLTAKTTMRTVVSGADIYYTFNGTTPTKNSTKYTSAGITINESCTLKAIAYKDGYETSGVLTEEYTIKEDSPKNGIMAIAAGSFSLILKQDGTLWQCGFDLLVNFGLDDNLFIFNHIPIKVMDDVMSMAIGSMFSLVLKNDYSLWACGYNDTGQLGDGTTTNRYSPVKIMSDVASVSTGPFNSFILKNDGTLWGCGNNVSGQLGDGTITTRYSPVKIMSDVVSMAAGSFYSLILKKDGTLWACGDNNKGQLGDGTTTDRHSPVKVMNDVASVSSGGDYSLILRKDGTLWACGNNEYGKLGDGTTTERHSPVPVMSDVASVSSGGDYSLILRKDGTLWACGDNSYGQLGDGTTTERHSPVMVMGNVSSVSAGWNHSLILKLDGTLWACGYNRQGQLGDGTTIDKHTPVMIFDGVKWVSSTAIGDVVKSREDDNTKVFSLSGQRLTAPKKGINIVGGRKVVIK